MIDFLSISITNGILIFLLITVLVFFCLYLYSDNKKMKKQMEELISENKTLLEKKIMKQESIDAISIENISTEKNNMDYNKESNIKNKESIKQNSPNNKENYSYHEQNKQTMTTKEINNIKKINDDNLNYNNEYNNEIYKVGKSSNEKSSSNILNDSVFSGSMKEDKINKYIYNNSNTISSPKETNFDLSELINKKNMETQIPITKEYNYLEEISNRLNEELKPQTIELTDYEKRQEEQAVISYKELLKFKDNNRYDEKQETINFIEELKNLRNSLK